MKNEIRTTSCGLQIREVAPGEDGRQPDSRTVEGYAIIFGEKSNVLFDREEGGYFREVIAPTAITQEQLDGMDVKMTLFHNRESLLARHHKDGTGSLELTVDERGVKFAFEAPMTADGEKCLEGVRRNDLNGCSFSFLPDQSTDKREKDTDGMLLVTRNNFAWMGEMTIGSDPAYSATSVNAREMLAEMEAEEEKKKEDEEADEAAKEAQCERELRIRQQKVAYYNTFDY